jgi:hypothetical protein
MTIAIMQPYVFPYIGYFQLVYAADVFVFYDDVNFINRGWINRNRILLNGKDQLFTIPCKDASQNKLIMDIELLDDEKTNMKLLSTIKLAYNKAPFFNDVFPVIEKTIMGTPNGSDLPPQSERTIATLAINSVVNICNYLGLERKFKLSSAEYNNRELKKADRLIDICHLEGINHYVNAAGGKEIYTKEYYSGKGVKLDFLNADRYEYEQFKNSFVPWLSMIDVLMFNSRADIVHKILPSFHLD